VTLAVASRHLELILLETILRKALQSGVRGTADVAQHLNAATSYISKQGRGDSAAEQDMNAEAFQLRSQVRGGQEHHDGTLLDTDAIELRNEKRCRHVEDRRNAIVPNGHGDFGHGLRVRIASASLS